MQYGITQIIDTLTEISSDVIRQQFYEVRPSDYVPHIVGEGKWSSNIIFQTIVEFGSDFELGLVDTGSSYANLIETDISTSSITSFVATWAKRTLWTIPQIEQALQRRNLDFIEDKLRGLKRNWDLGIQRSCFLGLKQNKAFTGLLNNSSVKKDSSTIKKSISSMNFEEYKEFVSKVISEYAKHSNETTLPNRFIIPSSDYYGLIAPLSETNIISKKELLESSFKELVGNEFKVLPLSYANKEKNKEYGLDKSRYVLYNYDRDNLRRDIPVDLLQCPMGTSDNYNINQVMYGQFSSVAVLRPRTMIYFDL